jgi:PAS domain S-box-containing protein
MTSSWKWSLVGVVIVLGLLLAGAGYAYYGEQERELGRDRQTDLAFMARLKADAISRWRLEQSARIATYASGLVRAEYLRGLDGPDGHSRRTAIVGRLDYIRQSEGWANVLLTESSGEILLSATPTTDTLCTKDLELARRVISSNAPLFGDMYRCPLCGKVHLGLAVAIRDDRNNPVAVLVALVDPEKHLFPMIQSWPTPSRTAETLLVRRDGDDVLFLNALRHRPDPALTIRIPLTRTDVPAVRAIMGDEGPFDGNDYRGIPVLSHVTPVPDSPWFMVAKVDRDEILAELRYRSGAILALVLLGIIATAALGQVLYRIRKADVAQRMLDLEREGHRTREEARITLYSIGDAVITTDRTGHITRLNPVAEALTGWTEGEAVGRPLPEVFDIVNEDTRARVESPVTHVLREGTVVGLANHTTLIARDGSERPIADSGAPIRDETGAIVGVVLVFRDQTDERQAEKLLTVSEARYRALFGTMAEGVVLHELVRGNAGNPVDYRILEANHAFEMHTGIPESSVAGRLATEAYGLAEAPFLDTYSRVAETGQPAHFETFFPPMDRHFAISVFRPEPERFATVFMDITERKRTENALKASEARYRTLFENAPIGIFTSTASGVPTKLNPAMAMILGFQTPEDALRHYADAGNGSYIKPMRRDTVTRLLQQSDHVRNFEYEADTADGRSIWLSMNARIAESLPDGTPMIEGFTTEITDRKLTEEALHTERDNLRATMAATPIPLIIFDQVEQITMANPAAERLFGQTVSSLRQRRCGELLGCVHRHDDPGECGSTAHCPACTLFQGIRNALVGQQALWDAEIETSIEGDTVSRWFTARIEPLLLSEQRHAVLALHDITDRKRTEEALRESEMHFRHLADSGQALIWTAGLDRKCDYFNKIWLDFTGRSLQQELGDGWLEGVHQEDLAHCVETYVSSFDRREPFSMEYRMKRHDGVYRWVRDDGSPRYDGHGRFIGYIGHCLDVTDRHEAEEARRRFEASARQQQKLESIGTLASGVAHEINNPLNVILNYGQLLVDDSDKPDRVTDFATQIVKESERVAVIVRNLLAFSRQDREAHSPARLVDIVERTLSLTHAVLRKDQIEVLTEIPASLPTINCRSQQIQQVLLNLLTNARDAMNLQQPNAPGEKLIRISASTFDLDGKRWIRLSVQDRGCGIPSEVASRVFDPFFTTKPRDKGTGLGLAISYGIIQDHLGRLWFESEEGVGTTFHMDLPANNDRDPG